MRSICSLSLRIQLQSASCEPRCTGLRSTGPWLQVCKCVMCNDEVWQELQEVLFEQVLPAAQRNDTDAVCSALFDTFTDIV